MGTPATGSDGDVDVARQLGGPVVVMVNRDSRGWQAEVAALGMTRRARSLITLDRRVRELLGTDAVDYQFHTGDVELDRLVRQIRSARQAARAYEATARRLIGRALLLPACGSTRNVGVLVGLSHQRIHQLMQAQVSTVEGEQ